MITIPDYHAQSRPILTYTLVRFNITVPIISTVRIRHTLYFETANL